MNNISCSNVKKGKVIIILYLTIVQNNNTVKLALFSTVESNILTDKNIMQMATIIKWLKKLNFHKA